MKNENLCIHCSNSNLAELKKNMIFDYMYIPDKLMEEYYIDFSILCTYDKSVIDQGLKMGKLCD